MTTKADVGTRKANELFKKTQPLPPWNKALAPANCAAPACQPAGACPPQATWPEPAAATPDAAAVPGTALWLALDSARDAAKEGLALGVLALAATVSVALAFGNVDETALSMIPAGAWAERLVG